MRFVDIRVLPVVEDGEPVGALLDRPLDRRQLSLPSLPRRDVAEDARRAAELVVADQRDAVLDDLVVPVGGAEVELGPFRSLVSFGQFDDLFPDASDVRLSHSDRRIGADHLVAVAELPLRRLVDEGELAGGVQRVHRVVDRLEDRLVPLELLEPVPPFDLGSDPLREELDELALARSERRRPRLLAEEGDRAVTRAVDEHRHTDVRVHALRGRGRRVLGLGHVGERHRFGRVPVERGRTDRLRGVERRSGLVRSGPVGDALDRVRLVLDAREDPHVEIDVVAGEREQLRDRRVELGPRHRRLVEPV